MVRDGRLGELGEAERVKEEVGDTPFLGLLAWLSYLDFNPPYFSDQVTCFPITVSCLS